MSELEPWEWIVHVDLDSFFASAEQLDKPSLRGRPVIVGGTSGRGVVATASYEARRFGIHSAMSAEHARQLCPDAVFLPPRFGRYRELSRQVMGVLRRFTPTLEALSLDEAFLDLAHGRDLPAAESVGGNPLEVGRQIRRMVREETGLAISAGVAKSKAVAKLASERAKPDGLLIVRKEREEAFLSPLPAGALWGVGPVSAEKLRRVGIHTLGQLANADPATVRALLGPTGEALQHLARGEDSRKVESERETKSISQESTLAEDRSDRAGLERLLGRQAVQVARRLQENRLAGRTVTVKLRYGDFRTISRSTTLPGATDDPVEITFAARRLLEDLDLSPGLRLLGVGVSSLSENAQGVLPLYPQDEVLHEDETGTTELRIGMDVTHPVHGRGWVERLEEKWVHIRFETTHTPPGRLRSFDRDIVPLQLH